MTKDKNGWFVWGDSLTPPLFSVGYATVSVLDLELEVELEELADIDAMLPDSQDALRWCALSVGEKANGVVGRRVSRSSSSLIS